MSESVACVLEYMDNEKTKQTRLFIRMIDHFLTTWAWRAPCSLNWRGRTALLLTVALVIIISR